MPAGNPATFVKSFFDESIQAAMKRARIELGTDALLIHSRETPPEARHLGAYEVVFGTCTKPVATHAERVEALRQRVEKIRSALVRPAARGPLRRDRKVAVVQALLDAGIEQALAREIGEGVRQRLARRAVPQIGAARPTPPAGVETVLMEMIEEIAAHFEVAPEIGRVTALIGPPGSGKTTVLVKLAIQQGLAQGRAVKMISADTQRIGGAGQLRAYAGILGAAFQAVENPAVLAQAVESAAPGELVLIDTPGHSAAMLQEHGAGLAAYLGRRQVIDTHLVLTATMRVEDLHQAARLYAGFHPSKLIFTRLDEATSLAAVFCIAAWCDKPISFLSTGQSMPEDLEPAAKERIVESLVRQLPCARMAAA